MKRRIALLLALVMLLTGAACAAKSADSSATAPAAPAPQAAEAAYEADFGANDAANYAVMEEQATNTAGAPLAATRPDTADADARKIVYNANMEMTADDPAAALESVIARATQLGGYLAGSYTTNDELGTWRCSATIKVPADALGELVTAAKALGKVDDYQLSSDDITLNYHDIAARLNSAKAEETQLLEVLAKCGSVEEILAVRESLSRVRSDIESYQGQINLWDNLVSYATFDIMIYRTPQPEVAREKELLTIWKASDVWNRMSRGFVNSARFVVNAVSAIGIFLAVIAIPAALLFVCVGLPILFAKKRRRARAAENGEPLPAKEKKTRRARAGRGANAAPTPAQPEGDPAEAEKTDADKA